MSEVPQTTATGTPTGQDKCCETLLRILRYESRHTDDLLELARKRTDLASEQLAQNQRLGAFAQQQSGFSRKNTDLSEHRTELSELRTDLAKRRTKWSGTRTRLARDRTQWADERTELSRQRTGLSENRTALAGQRTDLAADRTALSCYRSLLARGRTELALIRTGLALITIGLALMRYFGFGYWTILDGTLVVLGTVSTFWGLKHFIETIKYGRVFEHRLQHLLQLEDSSGAGAPRPA